MMRKDMSETASQALKLVSLTRALSAWTVAR
jgi:hypothetical protein